MDIGEQGIAVKFLQKDEDRFVTIAEERKDCNCWLNANKLYIDAHKAFNVRWHWWHFCQRQFLSRVVHKYWTL
jgi:hypothetical protein